MAHEYLQIKNPLYNRLSVRNKKEVNKKSLSCFLFGLP